MLYDKSCLYTNHYIGYKTIDKLILIAGGVFP